MLYQLSYASALSKLYHWRYGAVLRGGGRGIRTPERVTPLTVFKTAAFNHSAIPPSLILPDSLNIQTLSLLFCGLF